MAGDDIRGRYVWHELMTTDPEAAKAFYTAVIGWKTKAWEGPNPYTLWMWGDSQMGGLMELPREAREHGARPHWLAYIGTPDVDATTARAQELGATVLMPPTDIPTIGRFSILQDPQGASFAAFTPQGGPRPETEPGLGDFSWHELATTDQNAAWSFYSDLFGWESPKEWSMDMGPDGVYQMYGRNEMMYGGIYTKRKETPGPPAWLSYIRVENVHSLTEKIKEHGGQVINGPMEVPGGDWITMGIDPQGAPFAVHHKGAGSQS
jgi:predicted enzyme related to lactoylglutathione lyase